MENYPKVKILEISIFKDISYTMLHKYLLTCGFHLTENDEMWALYQRFNHSTNTIQSIEVSCKEFYTDWTLRVAEVIESLALLEDKSQLNVYYEIRFNN
jgi:hypothetical protein